MCLNSQFKKKSGYSFQVVLYVTRFPDIPSDFVICRFFVIKKNFLAEPKINILFSVKVVPAPIFQLKLQQYYKNIVSVDFPTHNILQRCQETSFGFKASL